MKKRLMIVDDHTALRQMLARVLSAEGSYDIIAEAGDGREALATCGRCRPDLVVLDLVLPELSGIEVLRRLRGGFADIRVLIFSGTLNQVLIVESLKCRPHGFVEKGDSLNTFLAALHAVAMGKSYFSALSSALFADSMADDSLALTPRELEVLQLVAQSRSNKDIAGHLGLARKTVENHRANLMDKLHLHDTAALTRYAVRCGMVS